MAITDIFALWCVDMILKMEGSHTLNILVWKQMISSKRIILDSQSYHDDSKLDSTKVLVVVKQDNPKLDGVQPSTNS